MKTTIEISDPILIKARQLAARQGTTLRALIETGLRQVLAEQRKPAPFRLRRVTFKGNGLRPELHGAAWDRLRDMAYEGHGGQSPG